LTRKRSGDYSQNPVEIAKFMRARQKRERHDNRADGSNGGVGRLKDLQA
jgi:hypothetical protein